MALAFMSSSWLEYAEMQFDVCLGAWEVIFQSHLILKQNGPTKFSTKYMIPKFLAQGIWSGDKIS